jgi:hypothetical protein
MFEDLEYYTLLCEYRQLKDADAKNELWPAESQIMNALGNELVRRNLELECITPATNW